VDETDVDGDFWVECDPWTGPDPFIQGGNDCDDSTSAVNPGLTEAAYGQPMCSDTLDNDCDELVDFEDNGCQQCSLPADCDDANPCTNDDCQGNLCVYVNNTDNCDDADPCTMNDVCSGGVCAGDPLDVDLDGYMSDACLGGDDCLDSNFDVNPGATEGPWDDPTCTDGLDNDCDGLTDTDPLLPDSDCAPPPPP
jgi:hypothetical protein